MDLKSRTLSNFAELVETGECKKFKGRLKVGVDLGTANTVLAVVDTANRPIAGISAPSHAIQVETGECKKFKGRLKVGVDLGTANTVLAVVDTANRPIAGISAPSHAIQDGVILN